MCTTDGKCTLFMGYFDENVYEKQSSLSRMNKKKKYEESNLKMSSSSYFHFVQVTNHLTLMREIMRIQLFIYKSYSR